MTADEIMGAFKAALPRFKKAFGTIGTFEQVRDDMAVCLVFFPTSWRPPDGKIFCVSLTTKGGTDSEGVEGVIDNAFNVARRELEAA